MNHFKPSPWILLFLVLTLSSCLSQSTNDKDKDEQHEMSVSAEGDVYEKDEQQSDEPMLDGPVDSVSAQKQFRYFYFSNGGLIGYFDDGTISGCPRCDFCKENVESMLDREPHASYEVLADGSLLIDKTSTEIPNPKKDMGWAMIDFVWIKEALPCGLQLE